MIFSSSRARLAASRARTAASRIAVFSAFASSRAPTIVEVLTKFGNPRSTARPAVTDGRSETPSLPIALPFTMVARISMIRSSLSIRRRLWRRPAPAAISLSMKFEPFRP